MTADAGSGGKPPDDPDRPDPVAPRPLPPLTHRRAEFPPIEVPAETSSASGPPPSDVSAGRAPAAYGQPSEGSGGWAGAPASAPIAPAPDLMAAVQDEPLLPVTSSEHELRAAAGTAPDPAPSNKARTHDEDDDDDGPRTPRSRTGMMVAIVTLVLGSGIAALVLLGKTNRERYELTCGADRVVIERGRTFPPWGTSPMAGAEWASLKIPPEAECHPRETTDKSELAGWYLQILVGQASTLLTGRELDQVDDAEAQLTQALLVARWLQTEEDRLDARKEIERLLGDVVYWHASAKLRTASEALVEAAKQFDAAAAQRPRHVSDAAAWAAYVRTLVEQLRAGPSGAAQTTFPPLPPAEAPSVPPGVALPVDPGDGSGSSAAAADEPAPGPPDAGVPTGGVLL